MGKHEEASVHMLKCLEIEAPWERSTRAWPPYSNIGVVLDNMGKYQEALDMYSKSLEIDIPVAT
jgi:hypothetical protein